MSLRAKPATRRPSRRSWPASESRAPAWEGHERDPTSSLQTGPTHPGQSVGIFAAEVSRPLSRSLLTRSDTASGEAGQAVVRPASTRRHTSNVTPSSGASTASSSGAVWPCERTSSPSPTRAHSTSQPSSSGHNYGKRRTPTGRQEVPIDRHHLHKAQEAVRVSRSCALSGGSPTPGRGTRNPSAFCTRLSRALRGARPP